MAKISQIQLPNGDTFDLVDEKVTQNASTSNTPQPILFRNNVSTSADSSTEQVRYASAVTITPSTGTINATKFNDYILAGACAKAVDNSISTSSSSSNLPTSAAVVSFVEGKGYITSYTETDPVFSASAAAGITSSDINNWNSIVSDDHKWNDVSLAIQQGYSTAETSYVAGLGADVTQNNHSVTGSYYPVTRVPTAHRIAKYDANAYLYSTTPSANDNSTKVATTAYVDSAVGGISVPTKTSDLTNDSGFITSASLPTPLIGTTLNTTPTQVATALAAGRNIEITHTDANYGDIIAYSFNYAEDVGMITSNAVITVFGVLRLAKLVGDTINNTWNFETVGLAQYTDLPTKTSDLTNDSGFVTTDEKVKTINVGNNTNYYLVMGSLTGTETKMASVGLYYKANSSNNISTLTIGYPMTSGHLTGNIVLAKDNNYSTTIIPSTTGTHNTLTLPNSTGTLALTSDIPPIPLIPTDLSDLNNDLNVSDFPNDAGYITGYTETDPIFVASAAYNISSSDISTWNSKSDFSGNYNDLTNKPTIPTVPTNVSAFTNDAGYLTSFTETDPIFTASAAYGISASDITSWNSKQVALVSGTNIKTINSQSLLGSGDITTQTIYASTVAPTSADGVDGDVWFIYTPSA